MIDGRPFDPDHARPRLGDVEIWRFMTDGWKDTIDLIPGETAEVVP